MGFGKPKGENVQFVSRLLKAYQAGQIQIKSVGETKPDPFGELDDIVISYETNFEGKNVRFDFHTNNYMTSYSVELLVNGQVTPLNYKEKSWILKHVDKKTRKVETDWTEDQKRGKERYDKMVADQNAKAAEWRENHPKEAAERDARIAAGREDAHGEESW